MPITSHPPTEPVLEALLNSPLAVAVIDRELRYTQVNAALARLHDRDPRAMIGQTVSEADPQLADRLEPALRRVLEDGAAVHDLELGGDPAGMGRVWKAHLLPLRDAAGVTGVLLTAEQITAQHESPTRAPSERAVFQLRLSDALRSIADPLEVQRVAARLVQDQLGVDRAYYAEIEPDFEHVSIAFDEGKLEPKVVGRHRVLDFGLFVLGEISAGRTLIIKDAATDARLADHERDAHLALGVSATLAYPLFKVGRAVALLVAQSGSNREWTAEETLLLADTAERTWEALERARSAAALEANINRQAFLLRVGDALRGLDSAEDIQHSAARLLSEHLGASGAGYAQDSGDGENVEITSDYKAPGAASLRGHYRYEDYGYARLQEFRAGRTVVRPDIASDHNLSTEVRDAHARIGIGASLNVPMLKDGRLMAVFFVNHLHAHHWTFEEVTLTVQTAERTWEAAQRARAEAELRASNEQFTRTVEDAPIPILLQAEDGEVLRVNRVWTALTGYTKSDLPTMDAWLTHAYGHGAKALRNRMRALFSGEGGVVGAEFGILTKAHEWRTWLVSASSPGRLIDGRRFAVMMATDITERKISEERLRRNAETFSNLVQGAPFGIYVVDADFRIGQVSAGALPTFEGVSPLVGRDFAEVQRTVWPEPFASETIARFRHTLKTGEPYTAASTEQREDRSGVESYDWRIERVTLPDGRFGVVCYFHDVTVPRAATQRLEEVNEAQRQFVSDAAHELRAPLTSIRGNLSLIARYPDMSIEDRVEAAQESEREVGRLTRLITNLLSVARGHIRDEIEAERVKLDSLLEAAWRGALSLSEHRRFELGFLEPLVVMGDPDALKQLFLILLDNAVKYSPVDGRVRLEAMERDEWAEVRVYNDGVGIALDDLERVFERFYRADRSRSRSSETTGTGLGLTIARQIVERHGGRVWLESAEGQGTTAVVRLPRPPND